MKIASFQADSRISGSETRYLDVSWKPRVARVVLQDKESGEKASFREGRTLLVTCEVNLGSPISPSEVKIKGNCFVAWNLRQRATFLTKTPFSI